jgi:uncharacterized cysteine cluster protein YcgN (CxxCxxCC family)
MSKVAGAPTIASGLTAYLTVWTSAKMTPDQMKWLPASCAYRLRSENKELPLWHPLISGHVSSAKKDPRGIRGKVVSESEVDLDALEDYIVRWIDA